VSHCNVHLHEVLRDFPRGSPCLIDHVMHLNFFDTNDQQVVQHMKFNPWYPDLTISFSTDTQSYILKLSIPSSTINPYCHSFFVHTTFYETSFHIIFFHCKMICIHFVQILCAYFYLFFYVYCLLLYFFLVHVVMYVICLGSMLAGFVYPCPFGKNG